MMLFIPLVLGAFLRVIYGAHHHVGFNQSHTKQLRLNVLHSFRNISNHPLGDILVVVHVNYNASVLQMQTYKDVWSPIFPHMVIFGEWNSDDVNLMHQHNISAFSAPDTINGFLAQVVMAKAMEMFQHPLINGFLYTHDDMIISPQKLASLDKNKIWIESLYRKVHVEPWSDWASHDWGWPWFNHKLYGVPAMQSVLMNFPDVEEGLRDCVDNRDNSTGDVHNWWYSSGDLFYLPAAESLNFVHYMKIFTDNQVFFEIAVMTYIKCFTRGKDFHQIEPLLVCSNWDPKRRNDITLWAQYCSADSDMLHPCKFSKPTSVEFAKKFIEKHKMKVLDEK